MRHIANEVSYATSARGKLGQGLIRSMENVTGRVGLIRRAKAADIPTTGTAFWSEIMRRYGFSLDVASGTLDDIPREGPLVVVANHPYGILDGLVMGQILSCLRRGDFRIMAHRIFRGTPELDRVILPINFDDTPRAVRSNLETRSEALRYLCGGGAVGVFPGGTVSTAPTPFSTPADPAWRSFTSKMITRSGATVLPIYFEGSNSRLFQMASHLNYSLRMGLMIREFYRRTDRPVRLRIGQPIPAATLTRFGNDAQAAMAFLRQSTYQLSPSPADPDYLGFEFEARYKGREDGGGDFRQRAGRPDGAGCDPQASAGPAAGLSG
jgi:putative hemolysin